MSEALATPFFQRVLLAAILAGVACGVLGSYVVAKRVTALTGGISHAAFGGVGLGYLLGFEPILGAIAFGIVAGLLVGVGYRRLRSGLDTLISLVWSVGMALGVLFIALAPGYAPDLGSYLFGSLLFVPWGTVLALAALDLVLLVAVLLLHKEFQAVCFDEEFAEVAGVPVEALLLLLLALTSLTIVLLIRVVGVILAIALFSLPAATARHWSDDLRGMMVIAGGLAIAAGSGGLVASWLLAETAGVAAPPGPLIILLTALLFAGSGVFQVVSRRRR